MERENRYKKKSFDCESLSPNDESTDEKSSPEREKAQKNLKKPKKKTTKNQEIDRLIALSRVLECVPKAKDKTNISQEEKEKIDQDYIATFEECNKKDLSGCEVSQNMGFGKPQAKISVENNGSKKKSRREAHGALVLGKFSVEQWIETVCRYYRALPTLINLENVEINGRVMVSPKMSSYGVSAIKQLEKIVEIQSRKEQYLNMYALNKQFENLCINPKEVGIFKCLFQRCRCAREKYGTKIRTAYRTKEKMMSRFVSYCEMKGYSSPWFYSHFASLPVVCYDVGRRDLQAKLKKQYKKKTA